MSSFEIGILLVIGYIAVFGIINRICSCFEKCAVAKAMATSKEGEKNV